MKWNATGVIMKGPRYALSLQNNKCFYVVINWWPLKYSARLQVYLQVGKKVYFGPPGAREMARKR